MSVYYLQHRSAVFPLNEAQASYYIRTIGPHYDLIMQNGNIKKGAIIHSTKIPLESFVGKKVQVSGDFHQGSAYMLCREGFENECSEVTTTFIDINTIKTLK